MHRKIKSALPRAVLQCMRRLPVGRSAVYLNELSPQNQLFFLSQCFDGNDNGRHVRDDGHVGGIYTSAEDLLLPPSLHSLQQRSPEPDTKGSRFFCHAVMPQLPGVGAHLLLPNGTCGQLSAYRTPHLSFLGQSQLFVLVVPRRLFAAEGSRVSTEAVLQRHLVDFGGLLRWKEPATGTVCVATEGGKETMTEVMLLPTYGCSAAQVRSAVAVAAAGDCRVFLLGHRRQRLLSDQALTVQELGRWCPAAFRSFQLDIHSVNRTTISSRSSALHLLEEARQGFRKWGWSVRKTVDHSDLLAGRKGSMRRAKRLLSLSVAEAVLDVRRDAVVSWSSVAHNPLAARLFDALHDRRHWCSMDAVLHASQHVVMPFLVGKLSGDSAQNWCGGRGPLRPDRLLRWSELQALFCWRQFEPVFGPMSQVLRAEDVTTAGGGRDPFILPLHDTFVQRFLIPRMRAFAAAAGDVRRPRTPRAKGTLAGRSPDTKNTGREVAVNILDYFNSLTRDPGDPLLQGTGKTAIHATLPGSDAGATYTPPFTLMDLPSLVKYVLYFSDYFEVSANCVDVIFRFQGD